MSGHNSQLQVHNQQLRLYSSTNDGYEHISVNGGGNLVKIVDGYISQGAMVSKMNF